MLGPAAAAGGTSYALARDLVARNAHELAAAVHALGVATAAAAVVLLVAWRHPARAAWSRPWPPARRIAPALGAAALAGLPAAAWDAAQTPVLPAGGTWALVGLDGLLAALGGGLLAAMLVACWPPIRGSDPFDPARAGALGLTTVAAGTALLAAAAHAYVGRHAVVHALDAAVAGAAVPVGTAVRRRLDAVTSAARRRTIVALALAALLALAVGGQGAVLRQAWLDADAHRPLAVALVVVLAAVLALTVGRRRTAALGLLVPLALLAALGDLAHRQDLRGVLARDPPVASVSLHAVRRLGDLDGDGHPAWLGGGDCAPLDPRRYPFAREIVGNGVDEDCSGSDLRPEDLLEVEPEPADVEPPSDRPDIVVVMVDTVRARELALHGGPVATPTLEALAARGTVFERFHAVCPSTHRAMPSLLTGLLPSALSETHHDPQAIADHRTTVFEALAEHGYVSEVVFTEKFMRERNLAQGVAGIHDDRRLRGHRVDPARTRLALATIEGWTDAPQLLWVHYYAPHAPHEVPGGQDPGDGTASAAYAAEIRAFDDQLGRLLAGLRRTERGRRAVVIVTSDHGEEFREHGREKHAQALYEESVHVPLVIAGPGVAAGRVGTVTDQLDLATTLAALGGARLGRGRDLRPALHGAPVRERPVFLELYPLRANVLTAAAVIDGDDKLLVDLPHEQFELYDLAAYPLERHNRYDDDPATADRLRAVLLGHLERARAIP